MDTEKKFLPIGSVVRLKGAQKYLMIVGFCTISPENPDKIMDYNGCFYPEGIISSQLNLLFNHEQIEEILFEGFQNEEEQEFKIKLNEYINKESLDSNQLDNKDKLLDIPILAQQSNTSENDTDIETL